MYIHSLKLKNFKGFLGESKIIFNKPDGLTSGSGLNIMIGENNCGKSTILQAIDFLRDGTRKTIELLKFKDVNGIQENDAEIELEFKGSINDAITNFAQENKIKVFKEHIYECIDSHECLKLKRSTLDQRALQMWSQKDSNFLNVAGIDGALKKIFETNFIWANTDPNSEMSFGASTLCGLLLKEIAEGYKDTEEFQKFQASFNTIFNDEASELREKLLEIERQIQNLVTEQFGAAVIKFGFESPNIQSFFKGTTVLVDDGISVPVSEKGNGMQRAIALALLQVYAKIIAYDEKKAMTKPFYFFIDEPELCLHPKGQQKLLDALLEISKVRQVFVTTHSPYFLSTPFLKNVGIHIFKKEGFNNTVQEANVDYLFPWSPTWGEINYQAYNLATVDFHNELFGYIQENLAKVNKLNEFDDWLNQIKSIKKDKEWIKDINNAPKKESVTLMTFIRNHVHHPENQYMKKNKYSFEDLDFSIQKMKAILKEHIAENSIDCIS